MFHEWKFLKPGSIGQKDSKYVESMLAWGGQINAVVLSPGVVPLVREAYVNKDEFTITIYTRGLKRASCERVQ